MKTKSLSKRLARQQFLRMIAASLLLLISGVMIYFLALILFNMIAWSGDEPIYRLAVWLELRRFWVGLLYYGTGFFLIVRHYWFKPFRYFQELVDASRIVNQHDDTLVELSRPLAELESELNQIKVTAMNNERAAREAEQRKSDLVTYLAHDLKTPITSVIGYLTLLRDEPQISSELRTRYLDIALDKAERLDELINEFFEITRFNLSHISLETRQVNLSLMLQQLVYEFQPMLTAKNLTCSLNAENRIMVRCDPDKLQRVFDNLLRNAVNYSYENSDIRISAQVCRKDEAKPVEDKGNGLVHLCFENDGDTISEEKLSRLFEQFYRLDTSRSSQSGGAGLGLAIAKEIVELHGGSITAASENDVVRFDVFLPLNPA